VSSSWGRLSLLAAVTLVVTAACSASAPSTPPAPSHPGSASPGPTVESSGAAATRAPEVPRVTELPTTSWRIFRRDGAFGVPWNSRSVSAVEGFASRASVFQPASALRLGSAGGVTPPHGLVRRKQEPCSGAAAGRRGGGGRPVRRGNPHPLAPGVPHQGGDDGLAARELLSARATGGSSHIR
jgi:hypothetical protein